MHYINILPVYHLEDSIYLWTRTVYFIVKYFDTPFFSTTQPRSKQNSTLPKVQIYYYWSNKYKYIFKFIKVKGWRREDILLINSKLFDLIANLEGKKINFLDTWLSSLISLTNVLTHSIIFHELWVISWVNRYHFYSLLGLSVDIMMSWYSEYLHILILCGSHTFSVGFGFSVSWMGGGPWSRFKDSVLGISWEHSWIIILLKDPTSSLKQHNLK